MPKSQPKPKYPMVVMTFRLVPLVGAELERECTVRRLYWGGRWPQ